MALKFVLVDDANNSPAQISALGASQDVNGTGASAQSTAIDAYVVRIFNLESASVIRVLTGANPTALATSIAIPPYGEMWLPITPGHKVAVLGGIANVCSAGI